jgi:hypothetical protein
MEPGTIFPEAGPGRCAAYDRSVTGTSEQTVRPATAADVEPLATVMARAFYDDPPFIWMLRDQATRLERARRFFAALTRGEALAHGGVDAACTGSEIAGAAIWLPPGHWAPGVTEQLRNLRGFARAFGRRRQPHRQHFVDRKGASG